MSCPRNLYPDTTVFVTVRCVHESYRLVPTKLVRRVVDFCFAVVSTRYRNAYGMKFYEYEFLSTHYHLLSGNGCGRITDFLQDLNALIARELNAVRGTSGAFFDRAPGIQTVLGDGKVFEHCVYTLANAVAAGIVRRTKQWEGSNSRRFEYGKEYSVSKPGSGSGLGRPTTGIGAARSARVVLPTPSARPCPTSRSSSSTGRPSCPSFPMPSFASASATRSP